MTEAVSTTTTDWDFLKKVYANNCNENEFQIFKHLAETYNLDPISKEIWCIKGSANQPARIFVSRDGHLAIAHRSGQWGSIEHEYDWGDEKQYIEIKDKYSSKVTKVLVPFSVTVFIYRKDFPNPTKHTVFWDEYGSNTGLWASKPKTMLLKVAECQGLRRAFDMHGFYAPEEINDFKAMDSQARDAEIEEAEKDYAPELFTSRKEREASQQKPVESKPINKELSHCEYDLNKPFITEEQMDDLVIDVLRNFPGQSVTEEEQEACRRSDGNYDRQAADVLKKSKYRAWQEANNKKKVSA